MPTLFAGALRAAALVVTLLVGPAALARGDEGYGAALSHADAF